MPINRKKILYSLCVEDVIALVEGDNDVDFDSLSEEQQIEIVRLGKEAFENGLDFSAICMYEVEEYLENEGLISN